MAKADDKAAKDDAQANVRDAKMKALQAAMMKIEKEHLFSIVDNQKGPTR